MAFENKAEMKTKKESTSQILEFPTNDLFSRFVYPLLQNDLQIEEIKSPLIAQT